MSYGRLVRFLLPLAVTSIVVELGSQVLNGGMARAPQATQTLAAYGLAWGFVLFLTSPLAQAKELGLVLVVDRASLVAVRNFVVGSGVLLMAGLASLALTRAGGWVVEDLHGIDPELGAVVRTALFWLVPYPLLKGLALMHVGLLLRVRRTAVVSYATLSNLAVSIAAVFVLVALPWVHAQPIRLPLVVTYSGLLVELAILLAGVLYYVPVAALRSRNRPPVGASPAPGLTTGSIIRFFWPLALIMLIQELSRPVINLFVARGPNPTMALAILAIVYTLGRIPYGWLNEIRNLASAFREEPGSRDAIRRFAIGCGVVSVAMMVGLFWTPLRDVILQDWIGAPPELVEGARVPLLLYTLFSLSVTVRAYYHGIGLVERRTQAMAPSAPARLVAIVTTLVALPFVGITGATLGVAALLSGFCVEATVVWWGIRGRAWFGSARRAGRTLPGQPTLPR
jgi:hypothetical protein